MTATIPASHHDLLLNPIYAVLTTIMVDGQPQSSMVWADYDGECVLINTALERQKVRNMQANPKVTLLVIDPQNGSRWLEVRGTVSAITAEGAEAHADKLAQVYSGNHKQHFYGDVYPVERRTQETRVIVRITPLKVGVDAIFK